MLKQKEWIEVIVEKTGCSKKEAKAMYDCVFDYMREQISPEELIKISGFGVLKLRKTAPKEQINLVTGKAEIVPEHNVVTFRPYFEIDPKPEPIEMEDEYLDEEVIAAAVAKQAEKRAAEEAERKAAEEAAKKEEVVEEKPAEEQPQEEAKEEAKEDVKEEAANEEYSWFVGGKKVSEQEVKELISDRGELSEEEAQSAVDAVKEQLKKNGKTSCEVKEEKDSFSFTIAK